MPQIRSFSWDDVDDNPGMASVRLMVGPLGLDGEESFDLTVLTLDGLAAVLSRDGLWEGRHHLFVQEIVRARIEHFLEDRMRRISGETWNDVASKVSRIAYWEFEDYTP